MKIMFWSDYACPYCYIGEARMRKAVAELGLEGKVNYEPRAFELDPGAHSEVQSDTATRFAAKYRLPLPQAVAQIEHISSLGRSEGIDFKYATTLYTNTFNAHRLMKLALSINDPEIAAKTNELLFAAYFTKNLKLADPGTLEAVGKEAGLNAEEVIDLLKTDRFGAEVREDERAAAERGVHGVPYFVFEDGFTVPGAISTEDFKLAIQRALSVSGDRTSSEVLQCGADGCALPRH